MKTFKVTKKLLNHQNLMISDDGQWLATGHWLVARDLAPNMQPTVDQQPPATRLVQRAEGLATQAIEATQVQIGEFTVVGHETWGITLVQTRYLPLFALGTAYINPSGPPSPIVVKTEMDTVVAMVMPAWHNALPKWLCIALATDVC